MTFRRRFGRLATGLLLATLLIQFLVVKLSLHIEYKTLLLWSFLGISA